MVTTLKSSIWERLLRRSVHMGSVLMPIFYFHYEQLLWPISIVLSRYQLLLLLLLALMLLEGWRLHQVRLLVTQRHYEKDHISGFAWSMSFSMLVILILNNESLALPIIGAYAFGDPVMGELRAQGFKLWSIVAGFIVMSAVWLGCIWLFGLSAWWLAIFMPILTVAIELPKLTWFDDNGLMQFIPLLVIMLFQAAGFMGG